MFDTTVLVVRPGKPEGCHKGQETRSNWHEVAMRLSKKQQIPVNLQQSPTLTTPIRIIRTACTSTLVLNDHFFPDPKDILHRGCCKLLCQSPNAKHGLSGSDCPGVRVHSDSRQTRRTALRVPDDYAVIASFLSMCKLFWDPFFGHLYPFVMNPQEQNAFNIRVYVRNTAEVISSNANRHI